jgi:hypothetical protein
VAAVAAFVLSGAWYGAFGARLAALNEVYTDAAGMSASTAVVEVARNVVLATVVAVGVDTMDLGGIGQAVVAALLAWVGFPVLILAGSVFHEKVPWRLAAIHAGDWLLKLLAVCLVVVLWQ